ncbi:MAG TPA: gas vesicle protein GvpG [Labilithrix sp.]
MLIVDSLLISGIKFVLTRLAQAVEAEMYDETHLREELLAAQMKLELGEVTEDEFAEIEASVLAGLREIGERKKAQAGAAVREQVEGEGARKYAIESVEADLDHRDES